MSRARSKDSHTSNWLTLALGAAAGVLAGYLLHKSLNSETPAPATTASPTPQEEIKSFLCPITQELMRDPWACPYCQSFEKSAIVSWLERSSECPMCCRQITVEDLKPNFNLRSAIEEYRRIHGLS